MSQRGDTRASRLRLDRFDARRLAPLIPVAMLFFAVQVWPFKAPLGIILDGTLVGGRIALVALGIALVYRANRIINFAQGDLGQLPVTIVVILAVSVGWNYYLAATVGLLAAIVLGILAETLIIARFFRAPRLILTVATIGLAQLLVWASFSLVQTVDETTFASTRLDAPFTARFEVEGTIFNANDIITMIAVPVTFLLLALWLRRSNVGIAVRASAESADRASMLGIPVRRLHTIVWTVATVLAFVGMFLRAGTVGIPIGDPAGQVLGFTFLVQALAAAVIGRMDRFVTIACAAIGLGILDKAMTFQAGNRPAYNDVALFVVILVALLVVRRAGRGRVDPDQMSTWQSVREVRPVPPELVRLPEVRLLRWGPPIVGCLALVALPLWLSESRMDLATLVVLFGIVAVSLVVLTGWAGQVSLGQMGFVGVGAAVGGALTDRYGWDLSIAMLASGVVGALAAAVIGYPALRRRGLTLAVSTLAFALFVSSYMLSQELFGDQLPGFSIDRPELFGTIDISTQTRFYYLSLVVLFAAIAVVRALRSARPGRVLIGIRENERAARAYGVNTTQTTLAAFAVSGFLAALAGSLYVHQQEGLRLQAYLPQQSLRVFSMVVIGGLGSIPGALLGAGYVQGADYFLPGNWQFFASGVGLLFVLMIVPGGIGSVLYDLRDWLLRRIAARRNLLVPSLVADRKAEEELATEAVEAVAEIAGAESERVPEPAP